MFVSTLGSYVMGCHKQSIIIILSSPDFLELLDGLVQELVGPQLIAGGRLKNDHVQKR